MGAESYTWQKARQAVDAIACEGSEAAGAQAAGISPETLAEWKDRYQEFRTEIDKAQEEFVSFSLYGLRRSTQRRIQAILEGLTYTEHTRKQVFDREGEIVELEEWKTKPVPIPDWLLKRLSGLDLLEPELLHQLTKLGFVDPVLADQANQILDEAKGRIRSVLNRSMPVEEIKRWQAEREEQKKPGLSPEHARRIYEMLHGKRQVESESEGEEESFEED